ncbi:MAG: ABC transporter permease [Oscillospiraceae bacterium]|nr:ABC transporter permease [Oscillospiraceae bacterium]MDD7042065.1 ABC transporter permease [Oscillospiraceae bacterium]MDY2612237.1 ABC transporter permease [Oscillospiraceae bacterium]
MKIFDQIAMCLQNLSRRKVRTALTTMGVVIGTCAIVVMISLGVGLQKSQEAMLAQMGDLTKIEIYNYSSGAGGASSVPNLDDSIIEQIAAYDHVDVITPVVQADGGKVNIQCGDYVYQDSVYGVYPEALEKLGYELKEGKFPTGKEKDYTILFGEYGPFSFYNPNGNGEWYDPSLDDPPVDISKDTFTISVGKQDGEENTQEPEKHEATVTGLLVGDWNKGYETVYGAFLSIDQLYELYQEYDDFNGISSSSSAAFNPRKINYNHVYVKVTDMKYVDEVETKIKDLGYDTYSMETVRKPMQEQANKMMLILGSLGGISLLVAAMGITNTMIMSIYERTREIGIMKVLGCVVGDIRTVFLMEAGLIGFGGGVIGVILSFIISLVLNVLGGGGLGGMMGGYYYGGAEGASQISVIPIWLVGLALVFSTLIGLVSGFSPANRAVKISALEAIKHE